jgi:ribosome-binding factor A
MSWDRFEKLVSQIKQRITNVILFRLKDPRVGFVTVTKVDLARDLKTCTVHYSVLGSEGDRAKTGKALEDARGFIQAEVGKTMRTRTVPRIVFRYDDTFEKTDRILKILKDIRPEDAGSDAVEDAGSDAIEDAGSDAIEDAGSDAIEDAGEDSKDKDQ